MTPSSFHSSGINGLDEVLGGTTHLLLDEVEGVNASRVVLDSLAELCILSQDSLRCRRQILALKQFFHKHRCSALLHDDRSGTDMWQVSEDDSLRAANPAFSHRSCGTVALSPARRSPILVSRPLSKTSR